MSEAQVFPVDPDFTVARTRQVDLAAFRAQGGEAFLRPNAPSVRVFNLQFQSRPVSDWALIENFRLEHLDDFFTFVDKSKSEGARDYTCWFAGEPSYDEVGNEEVNIAAVLVEAVNKPLRTYPTVPLLDLPSSKIVSITGGKTVTYSGYGFSASISGASTMELDGSSIGVVSSKFDVPLGVHTLKVTPGTASISNFQFVH